MLGETRVRVRLRKAIEHHLLNVQPRPSAQLSPEAEQRREGAVALATYLIDEFFLNDRGLLEE